MRPTRSVRALLQGALRAPSVCGSLCSPDSVLGSDCLCQMRCTVSPANSSFTLRRLLRVARLVEWHCDITPHLEMSDKSVALVGDLACELHTARLQFRDGLRDVVTVKRNVVHAGRCSLLVIRRMAAHLCLGKIEDEPPI